MFLTTHAAAGIALSHVSNDPLTVFGLSFASHFVLDFIPHGDENLYGNYQFPGKRQFRKAVVVNTIDVALLTGLAIWAIHNPTGGNSRLMLIGILGSVLPDFISHLFPIIHERLSWLWLIRWMYAITKPTGLRLFARGQNWLHGLFHHKIIRTDIPLSAGITLQVLLIAWLLQFAR